MADNRRSAGRPREEEADRRIIEAALQLMAQHGYNRMSLEMVAAAAGVTKPTIYRRYRGKVHLAVAALVAYRQQNYPVLVGETQTDLVALVKHFQVGIERPFGMAMIGTVLAEEHDTPELLACFRQHLVHPRRQALREVLQQAQQRGELAVDAPIEPAINLLIGSYYAQYLAGSAVPPEWAEQMVELVWRVLQSRQNQV